MKRKPLLRLAALLLGASLLLAPTAQALTLEEARTLIETYYVDEVPDSVWEQETIEEMISALGDPYTYYFTPEEYRQFDGSMQDQNIVGIGISAKATQDGLLLDRVYEDSPAAQAGLKAGDVITAVEGRPTAGESASVISGWIKGETGSRVAVTYRRDETERTITLTRQSVVIPTSISELREGHIGYIDCEAFGPETAEHFAHALETYGGQADYWVVDLRENTGGAVSAAVQAACIFTGPETLAYLRDSSGYYHAYDSRQQALTTAPVIALVDENTASAAELFAAAVRDFGGLVLGDRTFGKGVAQAVFDQENRPEYFPDGGAIKISTYRFYSAIGTTDDTVGIIPHLRLDPSLTWTAASLLCTPAPEGDTAGFLRLDMGGTWYIDLERALADEASRAVLTALLEAVPADTALLAGTEGGWAETAPAEVAQRCGLEQYDDPAFTDSFTTRFKAQIDTLAAYGLVRGGGNGSFQPFGALTRAELAAMLAQALGCFYPAGESRFSDVAMDSWYGPSVNALAEMGLVDGVGGGRFQPDGAVSHAQLVAIAGRMARRLNLYLDETALDCPENALADESLSRWPGWSREYVWLLAQSQQDGEETLSLLWDRLENIDPAGGAARGEAAVLIYNIFCYLGILPA